MLKYANLQFIIPLYKDLEVNGLLMVFNEPIRCFPLPKRTTETACSLVGFGRIAFPLHDSRITGSRFVNPDQRIYNSGTVLEVNFTLLHCLSIFFRVKNVAKIASPL